ncbi:MAG: hydrolase [Ignavibacteria bacterium]|nr:hydrolase [Ignavibacteria bacterium]
MKKNFRLLNKEKTTLLVIDIQDRILPVIFESERVIRNAVKLISGFKIMNLPVYYTEQYPKGLGPTNPQIKEALNNSEAIQKMSFSCYGAPDLFEDLKKRGIEQVVVCGIESHVCVMQTVLDFIANDFQVHVAADAISSRREFDYQTALRRMESNGAEISLTESVLFELLEVCGTDQFKAVSKLVK